MTVLGKGELSWFRRERISDRYGSVFLKDVDVRNKAVEGKFGELWAEVVETRDSEHIGDLFRGIGPTTPEVGERIMLGKGILFFEPEEDGCFQVGVDPLDDRKSDWMDPKKLYRVHEQTVILEFHDKERGAQ